jgi:hypothetical protein
MESFLEYEVQPCANVPAGLPRQRLMVLSPIWQGKSLNLEYPDGTIHTLQGWCGPEPGTPCDLRLFWTRHQPQGPAVCLALGGDHGLRVLDPEKPEATFTGSPFLALAESMIPLEVLAVIGPPPPLQPQEIRLLI